MMIAKFSLEPSFDCPFGWPKLTEYPIDLIEKNLVHEINHHDEIPQDSEKFIKLKINSDYLNSIYCFSHLHNFNLIKTFSTSLREIHSSRNSNSNIENLKLIKIYFNLLVPEIYLFQKWNEIMKFEILNDNFKNFNKQNKSKKMFKLNEINFIQQFFNQFNVNNPFNLSKILDLFSLKETQLQIILLLELIILKNLTQESEIQLSIQLNQISSSPTKSYLNEEEEEDENERWNKNEDSHFELDYMNDEIFNNLESALEGLIDRLAMWQIITGIENSHSNLNLDSNLPPQRSASHPDPSSHLDLDDVQRFWNDVIEENYTEHLPLLNRSFRPKLFPTSIYDPSASSSIIPTKFEGSQRRKEERKNDKSILSSVTRTPNLKRLERRKEKKDRENSRENISLNLMSPTMIQLNGLSKPKIKPNNVSKTQSSKNLSSRSLFNRRQVQMSKIPSKPKLNNQQRTATTSNQSSVCFKPTLPNPPPNTCKRKQSSPKRHLVSSSRTELITTTPRKLIKFNDVSHFDLQESLILVPDTPQNLNKKSN